MVHQRADNYWLTIIVNMYATKCLENYIGDRSTKNYNRSLAFQPCKLRSCQPHYDLLCKIFGTFHSISALIRAVVVVGNNPICIPV